MSVFQLFPIREIKVDQFIEKTVHSFRTEKRSLYRLFMLKVDYLFCYIEYFNRVAYFSFSIFTILDRYFLLLHS